MSIVQLTGILNEVQDLYILDRHLPHDGFINIKKTSLVYLFC
jgi:hypothetical protein